jgi:hypothetical protein
MEAFMCAPIKVNDDVNNDVGNYIGASNDANDE